MRARQCQVLAVAPWAPTDSESDASRPFPERFARRESQRAPSSSPACACARTPRLRSRQAAARSSQIAPAEGEHAIAAAEAERKTQCALHGATFVLAPDL